MNEWVLRAEGLCTVAGTPPFDVDVARGEMVGLAGLERAGQDEFLTALAGLTRPLSGQVLARTGTTEVAVSSLRVAARAGIAYLPRERRTEGVLGGLSVGDNFAILTLERRARFGLVSRRATRAAFAIHESRMHIKSAGPTAGIATLSGGNQQKVLIARLLESGPSILLLNDPTRGVDHPTRLALYELFTELARSGCSVVVLTSELSEIIDFCDRSLVFNGGGPPAELPRAELTEANLLTQMFAVPTARSGAEAGAE